MYEHIPAPNFLNKILRAVKWEFTVGDPISEGSLLCTLFLDIEEFSLLSQILNKKVFTSEKHLVHSSREGVLHKTNTIHEILESGTLCTLKSGLNCEFIENIDSLFPICEHEIEYGGICGKCGLILEE